MRVNPSAAFRALSNGSTFEAIGPLLGLLEPILSFKSAASPKVFCVLPLSQASDHPSVIMKVVALDELYDFGFGYIFG